MASAFPLPIHQRFWNPNGDRPHTEETMIGKTRNLLLALLVLPLFVACGASVAPTATSQAVPPTMTAAPTASEAVPTVSLGTTTAFSPLSPLPGPTATVSPLACQPESSGVGAIGGNVRHMDGTPLVNAVLYLGKFEGNEEELPLVTMDTAASPRAIADEQGRYCFAAIEPGRYGVIIWEAVESVLVSDPETKHTLQIEVVAGQTAKVPEIFGP